MRFVLVLAALAAMSCRSKVPPPSPPAASATASVTVGTGPVPKPLRNRPKPDKELPTTSANIWEGNLDSQVGGITKLVKADPKSATKLSMLSHSLNMRGKFHGDLDEIQQGIDAINQAIALRPGDGELLVSRAYEEQSLHRFKEARADCDEAKKLGADPSLVATVVTELDWNDGKYDLAIPAIRAARERKAVYGNLLREAQLEHDLGDFDAADRRFEQAEDSIADTSPLPVAALNVQRGIHKFTSGKIEESILFFREAVARIPDYVAAEEHLAEALHALGQDEEAITIYESIGKRSSDPEFMGALASIYRVHGKTKEADLLKAKATARYAELLKKFPEAMYWHASEYFIGEGGDPKKALALLLKNAELRPNSTSLAALARAQLANGDATGAKQSIDKALAMPLKSGELFWTGARVYAKLGDTPKSEELAAKARAFNPAIDKREPPLP
jgi:tetratricopeptide (TPR) repeat protein